MSELTVTIRGNGLIPLLNCNAPLIKARVPKREVQVLKDMGWDVEIHGEPEAEKVAAPEPEDALPAVTDATTAPAVTETAPAADAAPAVIAAPAAPAADAKPQPKAAAKSGSKGGKASAKGSKPTEAPKAEAPKVEEAPKAEGPSLLEQASALETSEAVVKFAAEHGIDLGFPEGVDPSVPEQLAGFAFEELKSALLAAVSAS